MKIIVAPIKLTTYGYCVACKENQCATNQSCSAVCGHNCSSVCLVDSVFN